MKANLREDLGVILKSIVKNFVSKLKETLTREVPKAVRIQRRLAIAVSALLIATFVFCYIKFGDQIYNTFCDKDNLQALLDRFGGWDIVAFIGIRAFQTVIKIIPAEPLEIAAGAFYGTFMGMVYCSIGSFLGVCAIILITKKLGRKVLNLFVPLDVIDSLPVFQNEKKLYSFYFMIYIIPSTPKDLMVYPAALTNVSIPKFLLVTTIARIPNIIISTWCGAEFINGNYTMAVAIFVASIVLAVTLSLLYKKFIYNKTKNK